MKDPKNQPPSGMMHPFFSTLRRSAICRPGDLPVEKGKRRVAFICSNGSVSDYYRGYVPSVALNRWSESWQALCTINPTQAVAEWADVIVWLRPCSIKDGSLQAGTWAKQHRKPLLFEIDDNLHNVLGCNPAVAFVGRDSLLLRNTTDWMKFCDSMVVSTPTLAEYYHGTTGKQCMVSGNFFLIDEMPQVQRTEINDGRVRVVWQGGYSHYDDLLLVAPALRELRKRMGKKLKLTLMGFDGKLYTGKDAIRCVKDAGVPYDEYIPARDLGYYYETLAKKSFDIGLCPLVDNTFNRCKTELKFMDYSWAGTATIASNVVPYSTVPGLSPHNSHSSHASHSSPSPHGLLAENTTDAWVDAISYLADNAAMRRAIAARARASVLSLYDAREMVSTLEGILAAAKSTYSPVRVMVDSAVAAARSAAKRIRLSVKRLISLPAPTPTTS